MYRHKPLSLYLQLQVNSRRSIFRIADPTKVHAQRRVNHIITR